ncbi:MAG: orotate phosphoribosyltransferase [Candidatus Ornithospirochaeta sp.]|nr:orotate phosphoribosyltransferase [Candidatus Ornithospirochaeta sp.]
MKTIDEITEYYGPLLAKGAFELGAIRLSPSNPFTWASGYRMPIYNDNRQFLAKASYRALICDAFADMVSSLDINADNIAGTATAGIPHATSLADRLNKPLSYVRSSSKDHGLGHQIEGLGRDGSYHGKNVLLIEDLISTGSSSINAVEAIRKSDGDCSVCLAIFTYGLKKAEDAFGALDPVCRAYTILSYPVMLRTAVETGYISKDDEAALHEWREDPFGWGEKRGFRKEER